MESYWNGIRTYSSLEEIRDSDEWTEEMAIGIPSELRQKINQTNNAEPGDSVLVVNNGDQINLTFLCKKIDYIEKSLCEIKKEIGRMYRVPSKVESQLKQLMGENQIPGQKNIGYIVRQRQFLQNLEQMSREESS